MRVGNTVRFFREFIASPKVIGAVAPSSSFLARKVVEGIDWTRVKAVVEYGPGTGIFTEHILRNIAGDGKFFAVEVNPCLASLFRQRFPDVALYVESARNVRGLCDQERIDEVDCIISGLPWASFPPAIQRELLDAMMTVLRHGGQFVTFAYLQGLLLQAGRSFQRLLPEYFSEVLRSQTVWMNVPPAFLYRCRR